MRPSRHGVLTVCALSVGVVSHRVTPCAHTKTKTKTLDLDLRPTRNREGIRDGTGVRGLGRKAFTTGSATSCEVVP